MPSPEVTPDRTPRRAPRGAGLLAASLAAGVVGAALVAPTAGAQSTPASSAPATPGSSAQATPSATASPSSSTPAAGGGQSTRPPSGVRLEKVQWITANRVALWVQSPAMKQSIQVQLLLPASWNADQQRTYPSLLLLDGLRARDDASGWTLETKIAQFFDAKNSVVVLPVGGQSSFYSDWIRESNGKTVKWETFLTDELPPLLARDWRVAGKQGVAGLSMGGTAAMNLAEHHPERYVFAGSFSGILDTSSFGMPEAIRTAMQDAGGYTPDDMWGDPSTDAWREHDPKLGVARLKGTSLYVSAGSGDTGPWDKPSGLPGIPTNFPGYGLELLSRMTSQTFVNKAREAGVGVTANFRPSGTHSWPYWQFEMTQAWPQYAKAVGIENVEAACQSGGDIAKLATAQPDLGPCLTGEYDVDGGRAQDFRFGRVLWSRDTGAHSVVGAIGAAYQSEGGPSGALGLPTGDETRTPDGKGRFSLFQKGAIYWSPTTGAHAVRGDIRQLWTAQGSERGDLGYPTTDEVPNANKAGVAQGFSGGTVFWSRDTGAHLVKGAILDRYRGLGFENSALGYPTSDEIPLAGGGAFTRFSGGAIYWSPATGAHAVPAGSLMDEWGRQGWERGRLGYPRSEVQVTGGSQRLEFEHGVLTAVNGKVELS